MFLTPSVIDRETVDHIAAPEPPAPTEVLIPIEPREEPTDQQPDAQNDFIPTTHAWESSPVPLSGNVVRALLLLAPLNANAAIVSLAALRGRFSCDSLLCSTTTLGHHASFVITLSAIYLAGLLALALLTRGLTEVNGFHLTAVVVLALMGIVAASGAMLAAVTVGAVLIGMVALLALFLLATGRFRPTTPYR